ncbi:MAG: phage baseplate assembly protein [Baekduiaceae bacterium]
MAAVHEVELTIGGRTFRAWDEVVLTHDLLNAGSAITVTLWRSAHTPPAAERAVRAIVLFAPMEVRVDGALQFVGTVERVRRGADREGVKVIVSGRDLSAAMLQSDVDPRLSLHDLTLAEAITRAVAPLGLPLVVAATAADARSISAGRAHPRGTPKRSTRAAHVDQWKPRPGERVWAFSEQLARRHGYLLYVGPTASGQGIILDKPAYDSEPLYDLVRRAIDDGLEYDGKIVAGWDDTNGTQVPTSVTAYGHTSLLAGEDARCRAAEDNVALRSTRVQQGAAPRPRYVHDRRVRTAEQARQRARGEIARANQMLFTYEATVQGWGQGSSLYAINAMANLRDALEGIRGRGLIIKVDLRRARSGGHTSTLLLSPRGTIVLTPEES